ncbi:MAG TPA: glutathione S-transferase family protein [Caulobacterales bacterium]|nr:glutathione S-transferase family protein [Caulobacterales bacterium]
MIKIFHIPGTRALRVVWLAEEMGLPYEILPIQGFRDPALTQANAMNAVPVLEDGDVRICESLAIMDYMMDRHGPTALKPPPADPAYPAYIQFFHMGECTLGARFRNLVVSKLFNLEANWATQDSEQGFMTAANEMIAAQLRRHPFLAGDAFTAADISCTLMLGGGAKLLGYEERYDAVVRDYLRRMNERPAFRKASKVS